MYQLLIVVSMSIACLLMWKAVRSIMGRIELLEDTIDHLSGRLALLEDAMALPPTTAPPKPADAESNASEVSEDFSAPAAPMVSEVITLIDDIDDEAKRLRRELRKRGLPARGDIEEMRARLEANVAE